MILVDKNVWSEAFRQKPHPAVAFWANSHAEQLCLPTVVIGELLSGVALMPSGRRQVNLYAFYEALIAQYADRVVDFDLRAARHYGEIVAEQKSLGRDPGTADSQIAAIARTHAMPLATRNTRHFEGLGLELIDPWNA